MQLRVVTALCTLSVVSCVDVRIDKCVMSNVLHYELCVGSFRPRPHSRRGIAVRSRESRSHPREMFRHRLRGWSEVVPEDTGHVHEDWLWFPEFTRRKIEVVDVPSDHESSWNFSMSAGPLRRFPVENDGHQPGRVAIQCTLTACDCVSLFYSATCNTCIPNHCVVESIIDHTSR